MQFMFEFVGLTAMFTVKPIRHLLLAGGATRVGFVVHSAPARAADHQTTKE